MTLPILWFIIIAVLICAYYVLDGFDLGAGVLSPFIAKTPGEKRALMTSIGPVWDGNEVWLLTAGGALFAAFAPAYATVFSGFYLAIMLVLFGLIIRAVSLEFRAHDPKWQKLWDLKMSKIQSHVVIWKCIMDTRITSSCRFKWILVF